MMIRGSSKERKGETKQKAGRRNLIHHYGAVLQTDKNRHAGSFALHTRNHILL